LSLVLGIILELLEKEINFHSEHVASLTECMIHHKDRLLLITIWSKEILNAAMRVRSRGKSSGGSGGAQVPPTAGNPMEPPEPLLQN
jgi:hypothetical protein